MDEKSVYDYILEEETAYQTRQIPLADGWEWNMWEHIRKSFLYKYSKFAKGNNDGNRPFKNIIRPILNVAYRSEGFDVKDIVPFVNDIANFHKSFLVKRFHPKWAREHSIDTFIDELVESYTDYGLALVKNVNQERPEVVPLQRVAFCDDTDILSGPICERHQFSPDQLMEMSGRWYPDAVEKALTMAKPEKEAAQTSGGRKTKTPGRYTEVYELHGMFPERWLNKEDLEDGESGEFSDASKYVRQVQIWTGYTEADGKKKGICLYKGKEKESIYKALKRDNIFGRACGFGAIEELFEPQKWVNYSAIQIKEMLDIATMVLLQTASSKFEGQNITSDMEKGQVLTHEDNKPLTQVTLQPYNKAEFDKASAEWEQNAMTLGSASEGSLGKNPASGTPFALENLIVQEGKGMHDYRQGKVATFMGEIYRDWTLKHLVDEMNAGQVFLDELTLDELNEIAEIVITNEINREIKKKILGKGNEASVPDPEAIELLKQTKRDEFMKGGSKRFLEILEGELSEIPTDVEINIAGKQKDLADIAAKLTNIFRAVISNPAVLQAPGMAKLFNQIIESAGLTPIDFTAFTRVPAAPEAMLPGAPSGAAPSPVPVAEAEAALAPSA